MEMTSTVMVVVDTNVWLHYNFFDEVDWTKCVGGQDVTLVLCPPVLRELDAKKFDQSRKVRDRAQSVLKRVEKLSERGLNVAFRDRCWLWITMHEPSWSGDDIAFSRDVRDDAILSCALDLQRRDGFAVRLAAADFGFRLKARQVIDVVSLPDEWKLRDEESPEERELKALRKQVLERTVALPRLSLQSGGRAFVSWTFDRTAALPKEVVDSVIAELRGRRMTPEVEAFFGRDALARMWGNSSSGADDRGASRERFFRRVRTYLLNLPDAYARPDRTVPISLRLHNDGGATAEHVDVVLTAKVEGGSGGWRLDSPEPEPAPEPPDFTSSTGFVPSVSSYLPDETSFRTHDLDDAEVQPDDRIVRFQLARVKVGLPVPLPDVFFEFASDDAVCSFTIHCTMAASNLPATDSEVGVKIIRG